MKNILVVFTGGTIGSTATAGTINTLSTTAFKLLQLFEQHDKGGEAIQFKSVSALQILSENLAPPVWPCLIKAIEAESPAQYDGIIVTHGTDTLAYTANALSFYFHLLPIPLLVVSSDYPLDDPRANGLENFSCAVDFIRQGQATGVFVPYRNQQQIMQVHQGTRLTCSLQLGGDFYSVQHKSAMRYEKQTFTLLDSKQVTRIKSKWDGELQAQFSAQVLVIKPYPGLNYDHLNLEGVKAVLHDLYHSGTACASTQWGEEHSLLSLLERCAQQGIKVYLAPAIKSVDAYESTRVLLEKGAIMLWNMSIEAAYVKLMLAYGNWTELSQIQAFLEADIAGEML
jgi:L-asparaginase